jgi:hypothetical protein
MRRRSKKTEQIYIERRKIVAQLLKERPFCEACLIYRTFDSRGITLRPSVDVNEIIPRGRGGSITDLTNLMCVCRLPCHSRITDDPLEAEFLGLTLPGWANETHIDEARMRRVCFSEEVRITEPPSWWDSTKTQAWLSRFRSSDADRTSE